MTHERAEVWDEVDDLLATYDAAIRCESASASTWTGELRLTLTDPQRAPSRSITFYVVGHDEPTTVARELLDDSAAWIAAGGEPMPVPAWMLDEPEDEAAS